MDPVKPMGGQEHLLAGSVQAWCLAFVTSTESKDKLRPTPPPDPERPEHWLEDLEPIRLAAPGRPAEWTLVQRSPKTPGRGAMVHAHQRAHLMHTLAHHELQAAELFAWAILAFPETPWTFRRGLLRLMLEELGHMALYCGHMQS